MKKILNIVSSIMGDQSFSIKLSQTILDKLQATYPGSQIVTRELSKQPFPYMEESYLTALFTPEDARTAEHKAAVKHSDEAIKELIEADIIVIGAPVYNFAIPSTLKSWIDHIVRAGKTFSYSAQGLPEGLLKNKKVYIAIASGGVFTEGAYKAYDFVEPYLRLTLGFIGLQDIEVFRIEGTKVPDVKETAWAKAVSSVEEHAY
jgi:FMN-dependent NADH-azoreductase